MGLRDRWNDRGEVLDDPMKELHRRVDRLDDWRQRLRIASDHADACETDERENESITTDEFLGVKAFDTAERERADLTARSIFARKERDRVAKMVEIGEQACEALARDILHERTAAAEQEREHIRAEVELAHQRVAALGGALQLIEERIHSCSYGGTERLKLFALWSDSARRQLDSLALQRDIERNPPQVDERATVVDTTLAVRTRDDRSGQEVPAYTKLPSGDQMGAVRIG
jgi:hypothetical protein